MKYLIGIDEVGRGPLAGPVTIGTVLIEKSKATKILNRLKKLGLKDSKKLNHKKRELLFKEVFLLKKEGIIESNTTSLSAQNIDEIGISKCLKKAIVTSLQKFKKIPEECDVKLDGSLYAPVKYPNQETIIKGDDKELIIAIASVIAKITRDRKMIKLSKVYPEYGFEVHKGYGTLMHRNNIKKHGVCELHRRSYCRNI